MTDLPTDLPVNWTDNIGMEVNADFLNAVGEQGNATAAAVNSFNAFFSGAAQAFVATDETTTSASYTDLATTTDSVTVDVGSSGVVLVSLFANATYVSGAAPTVWVGVALSGANTVAATDARCCVGAFSHTNVVQWSPSGLFVMTGLTPGSTTFKMKYKVTAGGAASARFANRRITVIPFP